MTRSCFRRSAPGIVVALALGASCPAFADDRALAKEHFDRAIIHLKQNELEAALSELESAQRLHPHFAVLYNIGQVYASLGKPDRAVDHLELYLELGGDGVPPERREEVKRLIDEQLKRVGRATFRVEPDGVVVEVDGREIGTSPIERTVSLTIGRHEIVARRKGYERHQRFLDVEAGARPTIAIELTPERQAPTVLAPLDIDCPIPNVNLSVDGRVQARTPLSSVALPVGRHELVFERAGYAPWRQIVLVDRRGGALSRCRMLVLEPLPSAVSGKIVIDHSNVQLVRLDGVALGADGRAPLGPHHLEVFAVGYRPWSSDVTVRAGATEHVRPTLEADADKLRGQQAQRTAAYMLLLGGVAVGGLAGGIYVWNSARYSDYKGNQEKYNRQWRDGALGNLDLRVQQADNNELLDSVHAFDKLTIGFTIASAALLAGGAVLYLTGDEPQSPSHPVVGFGAGRRATGWSFSW